jgi:hypothetical protein
MSLGRSSSGPGRGCGRKRLGPGNAGARKRLGIGAGEMARTGEPRTCQVSTLCGRIKSTFPVGFVGFPMFSPSCSIVLPVSSCPSVHRFLLPSVVREPVPSVSRLLCFLPGSAFSVVFRRLRLCLRLDSEEVAPFRDLPLTISAIAYFK